MSEQAREIAKGLVPKHGADYAYEMGRDYALNGANETNCHFAIFMRPENTKAWERGRDDAKAEAQP